MIPLRVTAEMATRLVISADGLHLDGLLMAAVAKRDDLPPLYTQADALRAPALDIPIARSSCGRYYLASAAIGDAIARELRYVQRRFPLHEAIAMGAPSLKRVATNAGACKAFRIPVEAQHMPTLTWYAVGNEDGVRELLGWITRLGRRRAVGEGLVREWRVEPCEPWEGFPVLRDGRPLRHLPLDVEGLGEHAVRIGRVSPPYWLRVDEQEVAAPC